MSKTLDEVLQANQRYAAEFGDKGSLAMPPARRFAILTCMDSRLDPAKSPGWLKVMLTSYAMQAGERVTTRFARS